MAPTEASNLSPQSLFPQGQETPPRVGPIPLIAPLGSQQLLPLRSSKSSARLEGDGIKIVVIGGAGLIRSKLLTRLHQQGHEAGGAVTRLGRRHPHGGGHSVVRATQFFEFSSSTLPWLTESEVTGDRRIEPLEAADSWRPRRDSLRGARLFSCRGPALDATHSF